MNTPPTDKTAETTEAAAPAESVLPVNNNADLATLLSLTDYCDGTIGDFAAKYKGQTIAFDAGIGAMGPHGDYDTRYDILLNAADYSETSSIGPNFQFRDVNTVGDLHFTDPDYPDTIGVGDNLRITAEVDKYEKASCLFLLKPVSTDFR